jgi:hypothetical protein
MTRVKRIGPWRVWGELALSASVMPAPGTAILIRLEDLVAMGADSHATKLSEPSAEGSTPSPRRDRRNLCALERQVLLWLSGHGAADTYLADTDRDAQGRVLATTTAALMRGCAGGVEYASSDDAHRRPLVGAILNRLGWSRRYMYNQERVRQWRYFAPPGLDA